MPTTSPVAGISKLSEELIALEDKYGAHNSAIMSSYFGFAGTVVAWMQREGVSEAKAHAFVNQILLGLAGAAAASPESSFAELTEEHQTHGGLNEQVL
jgi:pyrroline-5-carboxylate reductase